MPNPKRKFSHHRTARRRTHWTTSLVEITETKNVQGLPFRLNHCASADGYYKGRRLPGYKDKA
ncbi:MAG: 50S ribosomal protein L32 [Fimbriimonadaceae bacterium]|jgi:ribosomal protein L32|nr:50S ribosomal protein L32 [Fimbriimonadaceae bacterium]